MKKIVLYMALSAFCFSGGYAQTLMENWLTQSNNAAITNSDDRPYITHVDKNEMVAIAGMSNSQVVVSTYDAYGNDLWTNKHGGYSSDYPIGLEKDKFGNYYVGYFWGGGIRKIGAGGVTQWNAGAGTYFGYTFTLDTATGVTYIAGTDYAQSIITIVKLTSGGSTAWSQNYTGYYGQGGQPVKMSLDKNGNIFLGLNSTDLSGNKFVSVAKFDNSGTFLWHNANTALTGQVKDMLVDTATNATFVTGYVNNGPSTNMIIYKSGAAGAINWNYTFHDAVINGNDIGYSLAKDNASNIYVCLTSDGTSRQYTVRKYANNGTFIATESVPYTNYNVGWLSPKIIIKPNNNALFLAGTVYSLASDNMMALYKSNLALSGLSQIYTYNQGSSQYDYSVDLDVAPLSGQLVFTGNVVTTVNGNDYFYSKVDTTGFLIYNNSYNGIINGTDYVSSITTDAGNFASVAGGTQSTLTGLDGFVIKYDASGNEQWQAVFDGSDSLPDYFNSLVINASGQYYAGGFTTKKINSFTTQRDMWVVKTDANGTKLWQITQQGSQTSGDDQIKDMYTDISNNGYAAGHQTNVGSGQDAVIFKYNSSGTVMWTKKYTSAGAVAEGYVDIYSKQGGALLAAGYTTKANGERDMLIAKYDYSGNLAWNKTYNSTHNGNDTAIAIVNDQNNNVYVVGRSDSARTILVKYDASGNLQWAVNNKYTASVGPAILVTPGGKVIIATRGDSLGYNTDIRVECYDNMGNRIWTKGGYNLTCCDDPMKLQMTARGTILAAFDYYPAIGVIELDTMGNQKNAAVNYFGAINSTGGTRDMALDANGDVYVTGYFPQSTGFDIYVQKLCYTPAPLAVSGSANVCYGSGGVAYSVATNSTVTNYSWSYPAGATAVTATNSLTVNFGTASSGYITVQQTNYCGTSGADSLHINVMPLPSVSAGSDQLVCPGSLVTLSGAGALTYSWNNGVINGNPFTASASQSYVVTGADANNCKNTDSVNVNLVATPAPSLCMVTVDSLSQHNILMWDKTGLQGVASFNIYREDITNNYSLVGSVSYDSLSEYIDTDPAANPNITTKRYKISAVDTCGNEGLKSPFHNTIFVNNNNGTFTWNTYTIQGQPNPVLFYALYRDSLGIGDWRQIATTAGSQNVISDPTYATWQSTASWRIETIWNISCNPTVRQSSNGIQTAIVKSKSNITNNRTTGVSNNNVAINNFSLYPNPTNGNLTVVFSNINSGKANIRITSMLGAEIYNENVISEKHDINMNKYDNGIYIVQVTTAQGTVIKQIVKN